MVARQRAEKEYECEFFFARARIFPVEFGGRLYLCDPLVRPGGVGLVLGRDFNSRGMETYRVRFLLPGAATNGRISSGLRMYPSMSDNVEMRHPR